MLRMTLVMLLIILSSNTLGQTLPQVRAQLMPIQNTILSSEIPGRIASLKLREGDRFEQGAALIELDCTLHRARLAKAQALFQEAEKTHQVNIRLDRLGSISTLEVDVAAARAQAAQADVRLSRAVLERCTISAPFTGRVAERLVSPHQYVTEGQELMLILDDSSLEIEMIVPSAWLSWLKPGHPFQLQIEETGEQHSAKISRLGARIDAVSQSIRVFGQLTAPVQGLIAGMSGNAQISPAPTD